jgi:hypothetical protein
MATKKIIYFTAGAVATVGEKADIAALNALCVPAYSVNVSNGSVAPHLGNSGGSPILEASDFVAGTVPEGYEEVDVIDPDAPPAPDVGDTRAVIEDDQVITIGAATYTFTIAAGVITAIVVGEA